MSMYKMLTCGTTAHPERKNRRERRYLRFFFSGRAAVTQPTKCWLNLRWEWHTNAFVLADTKIAEGWCQIISHVKGWCDPKLYWKKNTERSETSVKYSATKSRILCCMHSEMLWSIWYLSDLSLICPFICPKNIVAWQNKTCLENPYQFSVP